MPDKSLYRVLPDSFSKQTFRLLLACLLGVLLYCIFLFINLGITIKFSPAILMESSFCIVFFYGELELIFRLDRYMQGRFKAQPYQANRYLTEYITLLTASLLLLTAAFVLPVMFILYLFDILTFNEYLWWQLRQSYSLVAIVTTLLYLGKTAYITYVRLKQVEVETERLQKESVQQQFETLKNYVNPAFLFSSLDTLTELVPHDKEQAAQYIHQLSGVYRYILENKNKELVTLAREATFMQAYTYLLNIQYGAALDLTWKIEEESRDWCVPPLTLQFVVENLLQHLNPTNENTLKLQLAGAEEQLLICYHMQKSTPKPVLLKNNLLKIMQKYEYLTDRKINISQLGAATLVSIPLLKVSNEPRAIVSTT
ncbi:sensor histidine kinase [Pontibacter populi]|uniref:Histidine kinase n=1 Tax=Pontibacter populi TaxID=890055 RepID=A0ABV1RYQ2_9BACT